MALAFMDVGVGFDRVADVGPVVFSVYIGFTYQHLFNPRPYQPMTPIYIISFSFLFTCFFKDAENGRFCELRGDPGDVRIVRQTG